MATASRPGRYNPVGYQQVTAMTASTALTIPAAGDGRATCALIEAEAQAVRWRDDGTAPTATVGMPLAAAANMFYDGDLGKVRFILVTSGAILNVIYYEDTRPGS